MRKQIDHFLLSLLWLLAMTLGAAFWFNAEFGFNIFDLKHWAYFGQLQATNTNISSLFYASMIMTVFIMIFGLYLIIRPRFRKISFGNGEVAVANVAPTATVQTVVPVAEPVAAPVTNTAFARPPRLTLPTNNNHAATPAPMAVPPTQTFAPAAPAISNPSDVAEIEDIFKKSGYTVKKPPRIDGWRPALFAIGPDEVVWIGGIDADPQTIFNASEKLHNIFTDTLEDIEIHIHTFVIRPVGGSNAAAGMETFDRVDTLREFMAARPARGLNESESDDFTAYSEYIDTVSNYFDKL